MKKLLKIFFIVFLFCSCNKQNLEELSEIPNFERDDETSVLKRQDIGYHFNHQREYNYKKLRTPRDIGVLLFDSKFDQVDYFYFLKFNNWFEKLKFENGIMPIDQEENLDCDNFALLYKSLMGIGAYKNGNKNEPAVAVLIVEQRHAFGGIPASPGSLHMINLIITNNGWFIFEAQTGAKKLIEEYPNQEYLKYLIF